MNDSSFDGSRRAFLRSTGIVVSFALFAPTLVRAGEVDTLGTTVLAPNLPGSLKTNPMLDAWIRIDGEGITVYSGKVELGTGVRTALWQIAADQLGVDFDRLHFITADTAMTPNEGYTAGSHTMADGGTAIFNAAAQVRGLLLKAAAADFGVQVRDLHVENGDVVTADGRRKRYEDIASKVDLHLQASPVSPASDPLHYRYIGKAQPRVDIPAKVTGGASYVQDMRLPGMVHARVVRPPRRGATLVSADIEGVRAAGGVIAVVRDGDYLAVVAAGEWQAIQAMRLLTASARWTGGPPLPTDATIHDVLKALPHRDYATARKNVPAAPPTPDVSLKATKQYVQHGSIGPSCAVAQWKDGLLTVWTHTQGVFPLRAGIAQMLALPADAVRCIHVEGSGCYGHNGADDVAADAALIAMKVPGHPVRVQWMRDQEAGWEPFGPAMVTSLDASADGEGNLSWWRYELWSTAHNERIVNAGRLLPAWLMANKIEPAPSVPIAEPEGDADRNAIPSYRIPSLDVTMHFVTTMPFRTSAMRSLGAHLNVVAIESAMDDFAHRAGRDAVAYRLAHLDDPRARQVVEVAARAFGWSPMPKLPAGRGVGFAFSRYKNLMGYCAVAVELEVDPDDGRVTIVRAVASADCGQVVNPDGLVNQIEGGIVQSASWTLYEQVLFDAGGVRSVDWATYPIARFTQVPLSVKVELIDRPGESFLGAAEIAQGPTAAAIVSALAMATGKRSLRLPLMRGLG
ncbi:xanthine dehydrogenase molybdopterin-binding subunit B [Luteibacter jiangsuensis]|uniref:Xanthine dehydrogenase molybdopterin-binding subunit B n=1 Tax=Luteibacter jiangsuensis TaxID=637577 RepID=A0ABT9SWD1_9GAMM|nr:molybdopterin cofactor-binding domain-containing protein [Luteibacter jiangsuensis]MDQ0008292.1 xanthine dehydrogenase molybdopterin-binding subunit B [Luteibacter jiangsuensis]